MLVLRAQSIKAVVQGEGGGRMMESLSRVFDMLQYF